MNTSESIGKLAAALSKAQAAMTGAKKASNNPFFKSKYSDLSQVMEAISGPFADNELSFIQSPGFDGTRITVTTRIMHSSGEWIEGECVLPPTKNDAQGYGSAITYAKRYGLQAMAGVPSVDDDGNGAAEHARDEYPSESAAPPASQDDDKPWYNDFDEQKDWMEKQIFGGKTPDELISMLTAKYKVNKKVREAIKELGK